MFVMNNIYLHLSVFFLFASLSFADDPLDHLTGTEEWDREEEMKKQALLIAQKKKILSDEFYQTRSRVSYMLSEWQKDLSRFQEIRRSIADILFQEESKSFQQVNVKEKIPKSEIKRMPARTDNLSIETGGPIIEKKETPIQIINTNSKPVVQTSPPAVVQPKREETPEPTTEEILKKQKGHFDDKGQFVDEELKSESGSKGNKDSDVDYSSP